jgi:hypothetical protein
MSLPDSPHADGGPVRIRDLADDVLEIHDGLGRRRTVTYRRGRVVRMETAILGTRGLYERVDQRKEGQSHRVRRAGTDAARRELVW